uniref:Uncharacterized protein n=1 Tax=Macaca fascicularis TaxID=9541 RepID=Q95KB3_MACFA|nr:hypothetical protein [Macaca fascicularis]
MFCRTSGNFGITYPLPILGKVLLLADPSEASVWCMWAVFPSSAWVMNKRAVWPESWGRLGRAHRLCDLGSGRTPPSPRPCRCTTERPTSGAGASTCPRPSLAGPPVSAPWSRGQRTKRRKAKARGTRINAWNIRRRHGHLETLSCASAKPGNF